MDESLHMKKAFLLSMIVSLCFAALMGIIVFISGTYGWVEVKILLTTLAIGIFSLAGLCNAALYEKGKAKGFAMTGIIITLIAFILTLILIWNDGYSWRELGKILYTLWVLSIASAHVSLLLLIDSTDGKVNIARMMTFFFIVAISLYIILFIYEVITFREEFSIRLFGVLVILDALGTIITPILHKYTKIQSTQATESFSTNLRR